MTNFDAVYMPVENLNDEQLVKFLEKARRRSLLWDKTLIKIGIREDLIEGEVGDLVVLKSDPPITVKRVGMVVNRIDCFLNLTVLKRWLNTHLKRILTKLKRDSSRFKKRTLLKGLIFVSLERKHEKEKHDPKLDYESSSTDLSITI